MVETSGDAEPDRVTVRLGPLEGRRVDELVAAPEFRFRDRADFVRAAILSFLAFKERELYAIRHGERWR